MAATSEARIIANRQNAQRSTGPKTVEGKERSRRNGLKHGMSGEGVVIPEEDGAEVDRRAAELLADLAPKSTIGLAMIGQLALLMVRMERSGRHEQEAVASRVRHAVEAFDRARVEEAERLFETIADDPRKNVRLLRRTPEGVERLIEAWGELREDLTRPRGPLWTASRQALIGHLLGQRYGRFEGSPIDCLGLAVRGEDAGFTDREWLALDAKGREARALDELLERIDGEVAGLEAHYETLDFAMIERDRRSAPALALFDPSPEATLARRYESEASRRFHKGMKEFRVAEAEAEARPAPQAAPRPMPTPAPRPAEPLGSCRAGASSTSGDRGPVSAGPVSRSPVPQDGFARGLDGRVIAVGRAVVGVEATS